MKQLEFEFTEKMFSKVGVPTFETWYAENSHERRQFGERPYGKKKAVDVYNELVKTGFFHNSQYKGGI